MIVTLTPYEVRIVEFIAKHRNLANSNVANCKQSTESDYEIHKQGFGAEFAVAKLLNVFPDFTIGEHPLFDVITRYGLGIDVKQRSRDDAPLMAMTWKVKQRPDAFVLCVGRLPSYRVVGQLSADEVFRAENLRTLPRLGERYVVEQHQLRPMDELFA